MKEIDARGMSCPQPLIMLQTALETEKSLVILTDSKNAAENCMGYAKRQGCGVSAEISGETYRLVIEKIK